MTYTTIDGTVLTSGTEPVTYTCPALDYSDGIYESVETKGSSEYPGIKQIKVVRIVENNSMTITITESTIEELEEYINSLNQE